MEKNIDNKAKFFAAYWGSPMVHVGHGKPMRGLGKSAVMCYENADLFQSALFSNQRSLLLKPLSLITDEDALMCYKIHFKDYLNIDIRPDESRITFAKKHIIHPIEVCILEVADYLRSKGYAIPYMDLSVDKQIEYGWVKLTTHA